MSSGDLRRPPRGEESSRSIAAEAEGKNHRGEKERVKRRKDSENSLKHKRGVFD